MKQQLARSMGPAALSAHAGSQPRIAVCTHSIDASLLDSQLPIQADTRLELIYVHSSAVDMQRWVPWRCRQVQQAVCPLSPPSKVTSPCTPFSLACLCDCSVCTSAVSCPLLSSSLSPPLSSMRDLDDTLMNFVNVLGIGIFAAIALFHYVQSAAKNQ